MRMLRGRVTLLRELWAASKGRRREVALYRSFGEQEPLAAGRLRWMGPLAARVGSVRVSLSEVGRVEASPSVRCPNCLREHGPLEACFLGVIAGVLVDRGGREIRPELLARVWVDELWDRYGGPATDWLEDHLSWLEADDEV